MSYDYERYDGKRIAVDGEVIGLLALELGCEVEKVWEEYHARLVMTEEQETENAKLRELVDILCFCMQIHKRCDDCKLNGAKGELGLGHDPLLACDGLHEMLKELGIEVY